MSPTRRLLWIVGICFVGLGVVLKLTEGSLSFDSPLVWILGVSQIALIWSVLKRLPAQLPTPPAITAGAELLANPRLKRIGIHRTEDRLLLRIPARSLLRVLGLGSLLMTCFGLVLLAVNVWALLQGDPDAASRLGASLILVPLITVLCPWWWFLGGEMLELGKNNLLHEAGFAFGRRQRSFPLADISDVRRSLRFRPGGGYQIRFHCVSMPGLPQLMGWQLTDDEAQPVIDVILWWQATHGNRE